MSGSRGDREAEGLEYFRTLERLFIALRGAPLLLSPADWEVARRWWREGVPLDLVAAVIEQVLERRPEHRGRHGIRSLRYFEPAVAKAWGELKALGVAPGERPRVEPLDIEARLAALGRALPDGFTASAEVRTALQALTGDAEAVEERLADLDGRMLAAAAAELGAADHERLEREIEAALQRLGSRPSGAELERTREELRRRRLRSRFGLPVLSLFSPAARDAQA